MLPGKESTAAPLGNEPEQRQLALKISREVGSGQDELDLDEIERLIAAESSPQQQQKQHQAPATDAHKFESSRSCSARDSSSAHSHEAQSNGREIEETGDSAPEPPSPIPSAGDPEVLDLAHHS